MARIPFVSQMEVSECGSACLAMVLAHYGHHASLTELRQVCGVSRDGASAGAILRAARYFGLDCSGKRLELEQLASLQLPAVLHWQFNHFVVLTRVTKRGLKLLDPAIGPRFVSWQRVDGAFTGVALTFAPMKTFQRKRASTAARRRYVGLASSILPGLVLTGVAAGALELLSLLFPIASQVAIDFVVRPKQPRFLLALGAVLLLACVARLVLALARARILAGMRLHLDQRMLVGFVRHLSGLPLSFLNQRETGDLLSRVEAHTNIRELLRNISNTGLDALLVVSYSGLMLAYDTRLAAIVLAAMALRLLVIVTVQWSLRDNAAKEVAAASRESAVVTEAFAVAEAVKAFGLAPHFGQSYANAVAERVNATVGRERSEYSAQSGLALVDAACLALVYWVGGSLVGTGEMTLGVLSAFVATMMLMGPPMHAIVHSAIELPQLRQLMARLEDIWEAEPDVRGNDRLREPRGAVTLQGVGLCYGRATVLQNITLQLRPGERVAFVGPSGSGKTSLARIIAGLFEPTHGNVWLDGHPIRRLEREWLSRHVALVPPDTCLFDASIHDNVALGDACTRAQVVQAARDACIHEDIQRLPDGYETTLGHKATRLSGGQAQRIGLARALLQRPRVLLLDEATASLDLQLETQILEHLSRRDCTQVVVTHRRSALAHVDRIIVLSEGRIVDDGPFEALAGRCSLFRRLIGENTESVA